MPSKPNLTSMLQNLQYDIQRMLVGSTDAMQVYKFINKRLGQMRKDFLHYEKHWASEKWKEENRNELDRLRGIT